MIEAGIFDGNWVVIEQRDYASNRGDRGRLNRERRSHTEIH